MKCTSKSTCCENKVNGPVTWIKYCPAIISFVLLAVGIVLDNISTSFFTGNVRLIAYLMAYAPVGIPVFKDVFQSISQKDFFNEFSLMTIATLGAFFIGEYPEGVAVMLFYTVGELFQDAAVNRVKRNISALLDVRPQTATVVHGDQLTAMPPEDIAVGKIIEVKVGERVALDGVLQNKSAAFNTAALTGESVPRTIAQGGEVLAGMIATETVCRIEVSKPFAQSALARVLDLVQHASERKAPAEQLIRKFARIYTPIVVVLASLMVLLPWLYTLLTPSFQFVLYDWIYRGLVFLVISCPCALLVSIPLGYFGGIGAASRHGILFKGSNYLEAITKVNTIVMDKTGTLTQGVFDVQEIVSTECITTVDLLKNIASIETQSHHPIAKAIVAYSKDQQVVLGQPENVIEIAGYGLSAVLNGQEVLVGNTKLLASKKISYPEDLAAIVETIVVCAINGQYAGYVTVADTVKDDAKSAIDDLREMGIKNLVMLSGDKQTIVSKLAATLGIDQAYGDLLPEGKVAHLEKLQLNPINNIAFVGDGINDAPVLAMSNVGIAMGGLGSDVAIETADIVIQTDQPSRIATAIQIAKATRTVVIQNICLAFGVKIIVLLLGAGGLATLWEAVFADVGVALLAILNASSILNKEFK